MSRHNGERVLAIGLDATEPALIRQMIAQDEMPALKSLLAAGRWVRVQSPAHIGSGTVCRRLTRKRYATADNHPSCPESCCLINHR